MNVVSPIQAEIVHEVQADMDDYATLSTFTKVEISCHKSVMQN